MTNQYRKYLLGASFFLVTIPSWVSAQVCVSTQKSTPTEDFVVHNDGTVTHSKTGLMWKVCVEGQVWNSQTKGCDGQFTNPRWDEINPVFDENNAFGKKIDLGYNDWRVPNYKELMSIYEVSCMEPAVNVEVFKGFPGWMYWSSSANAVMVNFTASEGVVNRLGGDVLYKGWLKEERYLLKLVRTPTP